MSRHLEALDAPVCEAKTTNDELSVKEKVRPRVGGLRLLWIEANEWSGRSGRAFLEAHGWTVDVARTGALGVARACQVPRLYEVIILDWEPADLSGSVILSTFREVGLATAVVVISPTVDCPGTRGGGAVTYLAGPANLPALLRAVQEKCGRKAQVAQSAARDRTQWTARLHLLVEKSTASTAAHDRSAIADLRSWLVHSISEERLTISEVLSALTLLKVTDYGVAARNEESGGIDLLRRAHLDFRHLSTFVRSAVDWFEADVSLSIREAALAKQLGVSRSHLGRMLRRETGFSFRAWRLGARLRGALPEIARGREQIRQIAYRWGWTSHDQLDRDMRAFVGLSPRAFRDLAQSMWTRPGFSIDGDESTVQRRVRTHA